MKIKKYKYLFDSKGTNHLVINPKIHSYGFNITKEDLDNAIWSEFGKYDKYKIKALFSDHPGIILREAVLKKRIG